MLLDQIDGALARLLDAHTRIGAELDSFSDFVAFGLAPAFLVLGAPTANAAPAWRLVESGLALVYVFACAVRLARYNTRDAPSGAQAFAGWPSTLAGAPVAAALLTATAHGARLDGLALAGLLGVLGVLMVSDPLRPLKIHVLATRIAARGRPWAIVVLANLVAVYATVLWRIVPEYVLLLAVLYGSVGSVLGRRAVDAPLRPSGVAGSSG
jgi:CDP-diacylglycerol---serine O-phosphatidyltransferase